MTDDTSSIERAQVGQDVVGLGPVEVRRALLAAAAAAAVPSTSSAVAVVRAAGETKATWGSGDRGAAPEAVPRRAWPE